MEYRIGVDIGGSSAKLGLVDAAGTIQSRTSFPTGRATEAESLVEQLQAACRQIAKGVQITALGIAAPGFRMANGEGVENVSNLPAIDGYALRSRLASVTGWTTYLDNDANAAAMGEYRFGGGRGARRLLVLTLGTGIGGGMVVEGEVLRVCCGGLGDPGHLMVDPQGPACACGGRGCAEAVAAVPGILRRASAALGRSVSSLHELRSALASEEEAGTARALLEQVALDLTVVLASLTHILGPDRILLGGGGFDALRDHLTGPLRSNFFRCVQPFFGAKLSLDYATLGNDAGLIGAAWLGAPAALLPPDADSPRDWSGV